MAANDTEIEIKIPVDKETFFKVREKLKGNPVKKVQQKDDYFTPSHRNFVEPEFPFEWLSIRKRGDSFILNYKHFYPENVKTFTHCDEFETEIKDSEKIEKMFSALDLKKLVTVEKEREAFRHKNEFEIALDSVKDLGYFIEIEALKDFGSVELTREKLFEFARNLGIDVSNPDKRGYPFLLMEKRGLIKSL
jgi:adenylate cyclase class 2